MLWKGFQRPKRLEVDRESLTPTYGKFIAQPLERGFGTTLGNALRRCLLSSIEGATVTALHIEGVLHEFSSIPGVVEDVTDLVLNLKQVPIRLHSEDAKVLSVDVQGPGTATSGDLSEASSVEVDDHDVHIATVNEEGHLKMQVKIERGRGYRPAEQNFDEAMGIGWIPVDSAHSPVRRCNYRVEAARLGQTTDYERLVLEVWTNGTVRPEEAVSLASMLLKDHLTIFISAEDSLLAPEPVAETEEMAGMDQLLARRIDDLDLSVRSANCLKNANINTLRDLVQKSEKDMLETKNFGKKSLEELQELLGQLGLEFGMDVPDQPVA